VATTSSLEVDCPPWQDFTTSALGPDNGSLVTHINETQDLLRVQMKKIQSEKVQTTEEWLRNYSLESLQLTLKHLINKGNIILDSRNGVEEVEFTEETITNFESRLSEVIELYQQRIQWLLQDSRKVFGLIKGTKVGLVVHVSDTSYGHRLLDFQKALLVNNNNADCGDYNILIKFLYPNKLQLHEAKQWIQQLEPGRGCNLLKALKHVLTMKELNSLVLILGSCPDQSSEILSGYAQQCVLGRKLQIHAVTYDCSHPASLVSSCVNTYFLRSPAVLKNLAEAVRGRYHCYSSKGENFDSSDVHLLLQESQKAKNLLKSIKQSFQRRIGGSLISRIEATQHVFYFISLFLAIAKKLNLYQVLAPNAFSPVEEFVPILKKKVSSTLHEKAMMQFEWYDGTVKNIHVDLPVLYNYQKMLAKMVRIYEKRIDWLSVASRRIWGSVCERRYCTSIVLFSIWNWFLPNQKTCKMLGENKAFVASFFELQTSFRWVLGLQCKGSRNVMSALRRAVEVDFKDKDVHKSQGLYLLATGIPDQETHRVSAYVAQVCKGVDLQLHVCLFSVTEAVDSSGIIPARYANSTETAVAFREIAQAGNGRFHWFGEAGIFESDDITVIVSEMEKANNYSQKSIKENHGAERNASVRALAWRPTSAKAEIPPGVYG
ncbi:Vwa3a, partial [Columba guinea]